MNEIIHESFTLSLLVCSISISLSTVVLIMVWLFIRNRNEYYVNGTKFEGYINKDFFDKKFKLESKDYSKFFKMISEYNKRFKKSI